MFSKLKFATIYWLMWILVFEFGRLAFLLYNVDEARSFPLAGVIQTFTYGIRMDASMASYLSLIPCLFLVAAIFSPKFSSPALYKIYTAIIILPVLLIIFSDLPGYKAWGNRLDATALKYLSSPTEVWASISNLPVFWILLFLTITYIFLYYCFAGLITNNRGLQKGSYKKLFQASVLLAFNGLQVIPLRGGFQFAPLNQSTVYFSRHNFLNLAALNAPWNFMHSMAKGSEFSKNPFLFLPAEEASALKDSLLLQAGSTEKLIDPAKTPAPNIIVIVWESFTEKETRLRKSGHEVTPGFNTLKNDGIYFSNIYASGDRTDKGIVAVLSGYPAQPTTSIIKSPRKAGKLPTLPKVFLDKKYHTSFYYGGALEFANMKSYLLGCGFDDLTSKEDFAEKDQNSKWGAHDNVVKDKLFSDVNRQQEPFFATWLTLSSHEPYETPVSTVIPGSDDESLFANSMHYTDSTIYDFVQQCKQQLWWKNTILIITADHGHPLPRTPKKIDRFKIPLLVLGGALTKQGVTVPATGSQTDIAATLLAQIETKSPFVWSKDLMNPATKKWAYFSFNNGFGFVEPNHYFVFDNVGKIIIEKNGNLTEKDIKNGKAIEQETFADYLQK